jgi:hypothetical protein
MLACCVFLVIGLLALAAPARASDEVLAAVPGAVRIAAYGGWAVFAVRQPDGMYALQSWHDGVVAPVGVAPSWYGFNHDVGPDEQGRPTVVYSRCVRPARGQSADAPLRGCDLFAVTLGGSVERRLAVSRPEFSELAPAIWGDALVFGRRRAKQRRAEIVLSRARRPLKRLGPGSLPPCSRGCRRAPSKGFPTVSDLGPQAVAYNWQLSGGDTFLGSGTELRIARLDGSRARIAAAGWSDGTCGSITRSPNVSGLSALFGYGLGAGCGGDSFVRFDLVGARRFVAAVPTLSRQVSVAWDGEVVYWIRQTGQVEECAYPETRCELVRSTGLPFARVKGGEVEPPIEPEVLR